MKNNILVLVLVLGLLSLFMPFEIGVFMLLVAIAFYLLVLWN